jgi:hypothetical protein
MKVAVLRFRKTGSPRTLVARTHPLIIAAPFLSEKSDVRLFVTLDVLLLFFRLCR